MQVIGIKFKKSPKVYYFEAGEYSYSPECEVIVETARGTEMGKVVMMPKDMEESEIKTPLKPIIRMADDADREQYKKLEEKRPETMRITAEKISKSKLNMKLVDVEYTFDGTKLIVYFSADGRVDFRELVRDLASSFKVRIELRQIGARDECQVLGGIGPCGRVCCCKAHLPDYTHVSIKMAKTQNLSLNPGKISGLCGRLMCCLEYENAYYAEMNKKMPKIGSEVIAADGKKGLATAINQLKEMVRVRFEENDKIEYRDLKLSEITFKGKSVSDTADEEDGGADTAE